jgi:hypothetical protein
VEPIDDLDRLWGPVSNPFGIEPTPIAADDLDTGVRLQPLRNRGGRAHREQIEHLMAFEIADHGPETSASPPGPFVKPYHSWGRKHGEGGTMNQTYNRPVTPWYAQRMREPHPGTTSHR